MSRLVLLHTNDVHGDIEALARVATLVERIRAESHCPVVYVDAGDVEETTTWISNATKGAAMHRLLSAAGCEAAAVGDASWLRYGPQVLPSHAAASSYPLLLANVRASGSTRTWRSSSRARPSRKASPRAGSRAPTCGGRATPRPIPAS